MTDKVERWEVKGEDMLIVNPERHALLLAFEKAAKSINPSNPMAVAEELGHLVNTAKQIEAEWQTYKGKITDQTIKELIEDLAELLEQVPFASDGLEQWKVRFLDDGMVTVRLIKAETGS